MTDSQKSPYRAAIDAFYAAVYAVKDTSSLSDADKAKIESRIQAFVKARDNNLTDAEKFGDDPVEDTINIADTAKTIGIDAQKILTGINRAPT